MDTESRKAHWEKVYQARAADAVSWYQPLPRPSLEWVERYCPDKKAAIIDIGCGDAFLSEALLQKGYENLTAMDISRQVIGRARQRMGEIADKIHWIVGDALNFKSDTPFDLWHDRAAFHFLTAPAEISRYAALAATGVRQNGLLLIGAFSENGPDRCSGLPVHQYNEESLALVFRHNFVPVTSTRLKHLTPAGKEQDFLFILLKRM